jgi:hypothetical protein
MVAVRDGAATPGRVCPVLIDDFLPAYDVSERHHTLVLAPSERTYDAARRVDLARSKLVRGMVAARGIPAMIRRRTRSVPRSLTVDDLLATGFVLLGEDPGHEFVLGVVGTFWRPSGGVVRLAPEEFASFDQVGMAKAAWNFRVIPDGDDRTFVITETRAHVPDEPSRRKFVLYWAAIGPFSGVVRKQALALIKADAERRP